MARAQTIKTGPEIDVSELRQFARDLRRLGDEYADELKDLNQEVAQLVVDDAQGIASGAGRQQAAAAADLKARRRQREAVIALGASGRSADWALGAEFGARRWRQFPQWRGNQWQEWDSGVGYFLHPAIRGRGDDVAERYGDRLLELARRAAFRD